MECPKCGERVYPTDTQCMSCGTKLSVRTTKATETVTEEMTSVEASSIDATPTDVYEALEVQRRKLWMAGAAAVFLLIVCVVLAIALTRHSSRATEERSAAVAPAPTSPGSADDTRSETYTPVIIPGLRLHNPARQSRVAPGSSTASAPVRSPATVGSTPPTTPAGAAPSQNFTPASLAQLNDDQFAWLLARMFVASPPKNDFGGGAGAVSFFYIASPNVDDNEATRKLLQEYGISADQLKAEYQRRMFPPELTAQKKNNEALFNKWMSMVPAAKGR